MKKQLLALAAVAALGIGAVAGDSTPRESAQPTAHVGYMLADSLYGPGPADYWPGFGGAIGGRFSEWVGDIFGRQVGAFLSRPVPVAANTAARAAFARGGMLMGARIGGMIGAFGGPVGFIVGTAAGMA